MGLSLAGSFETGRISCGEDYTPYIDQFKLKMGGMREKQEPLANRWGIRALIRALFFLSFFLKTC